MRIVFMGTPRYAATILEELAAHHDVAAVYTKPDAVRGRGSRLVPSPVKELASKLGIAVFEPRTLRDEQVQRELAAIEPEVICVAAYAKILPKEVLGIPSLGCINVHASLLPRWRGAAPVERAILAGDSRAGVCIMQMEEGLDTGAYCVRREIPIGDFNAEELTDELANIGAQALLTALVHIESGEVSWISQDDSLATYASKVEKRELYLSAQDTRETALRKIRAASDAHACKARIAGKAVTIISALDTDSARSRNDGADIFLTDRGQGASLMPAMEVGPQMAKATKRNLYLGLSDGTLEITRLKPDGKADMDGASFAQGIPGIKRGVTWEPLDE